MIRRYLKFGFALTLIFLLCVVGSTNPQDRNSNPEKTYKELVQHWARAVSSHDIVKMSEAMSKDYIWHFPGRDSRGHKISYSKEDYP